VIAGGTGWLGTHIRNKLHSFNPSIQVVTISRYPTPGGITWDDVDKHGLPEDTNVVINVTGRNIFERRWTSAFKKELIDSRVEPAKKLVCAINKAEKQNNSQLKVLISASGSAYPPSLTKEYTEYNGEYGDDFGGILCKEMEKAIKLPETSKVRTVICRIGIVFGRGAGGGLPWILPQFRLGLGGTAGSGNQIVPWIHVDDLSNIILEVIQNQNITGILHCTSPEWVTNKQLAETLSKILGKPAILHVPELLVQAALGERSYLVLQGKKVMPKRLVEEFNFLFKFSHLEDALIDLLRSKL